jgi:hypothetical protein
VRKIGDRLRVSARLLSSDGYELWSDKFDRGVSDAFAIQEEIARAVVAALRLRVQSDPARHPGTTNAQAYEMYMRGGSTARDRNRELPAGTADVRARHRAGPRIRAAACRHRGCRCDPALVAAHPQGATAGAPRQSAGRER